MTVQKTAKGYVVDGSTFNLNKFQLQDKLKELQEELKHLPERINKIKDILQFIKEEERGATERVHKLAYEMYVDELDNDKLHNIDDFHEHWNYTTYVDYAKVAMKHLGVK